MLYMHALSSFDVLAGTQLPLFLDERSVKSVLRFESLAD